MDFIISSKIQLNQPHLTSDEKEPLFPLLDTSFTIPAPQLPERLMSEGVSFLQILSKASTPFKTKLSEEVHNITNYSASRS